MCVAIHREAHEHAIAEKHNPDHSNVIRPRRGYLSTHAMKHSCTIRALLPVLRGCHLWALRIAQAKDSGAVRQYCTIRCPSAGVTRSHAPRLL